MTDDKQYQQCEVCKCAHGELHVFDSERTINSYIKGRVQEAKKSNPAGGYAEFELPLNCKDGYKVLAQMTTAFEVLDETKDGIQYHDPDEGWLPDCPDSVQTADRVSDSSVSASWSGHDNEKWLQGRGGASPGFMRESGGCQWPVHRFRLRLCHHRITFGA